VGVLLGFGLISLVVDSPRYNPWLGAAYGIGTALVVDEFALLLNLRDVYRSTEGRLSVDLALATMAVAAVYFAAKSFWRRRGRESALSLREHLNLDCRRFLGLPSPRRVLARVYEDWI
jgi:hypothetical protein